MNALKLNYVHCEKTYIKPCQSVNCQVFCTSTYFFPFINGIFFYNVSLCFWTSKSGHRVDRIEHGLINW